MGVIIVCLFIAGLFIGSFYNVVAIRLCKNESIVFPGSHCVNCNHKLAWYELIPVFSYLGLRGKCKKCKIHISWQYPLVELVTGLLFVISFLKYGFTYETLVSIVVVSVVLITFVTDVKHMIILDEVVFFGCFFLLIFYFLMDGIPLVISSLVRGLLLFFVLLSIKLIGDRAFKQESLGWGDVKLSFFVGMVLGIKLGVIYLFLASFIALPYAIYSSVRKNNGILPFGPFLVASFLFIYWHSAYVIQFLQRFLGV